MFENDEFEIYESIIKTYAINEIHDVIENFNKQQLNMRKILEDIKIRFFQLQNLIAEFDAKQKQHFLTS